MEKFSKKTVCTTLFSTLISYTLGTVIFFGFNLLGGFIYLALCLVTILLSLKFRCIHCYYYGKLCSFGFGKLSKLIFIQGNSTEFSNPKNIFPVALLSFGTTFFPLIAGIIQNISNFSLLNLFLLIIYILFGIFPNFFIRRNVCKHCQQGQLGCPAYTHMIEEGHND